MQFQIQMLWQLGICISSVHGPCRYVRESKAVQKISGYADSSMGEHAPDELSRPSDGTGAPSPFLLFSSILVIPLAFRQDAGVKLPAA